jgi:FKBP-type peptidyl-prolyl cis-trans isomerase SlyD
MTEQPLHFVRQRQYTRVAKDKVVTLKSATFDAATGELIEYRTDLTYLHGGYGGAPAKVEHALEGLAVDSHVEVTLSPEEGYGAHDPRLLMTLPASELPDQAHQVGAQVNGEAEDGKTVKFRVLKIGNGMITLDGNHALAGRTVKFVLEVTAIRAATAEELAAGYAFRRTPAATGHY